MVEARRRDRCQTGKDRSSDEHVLPLARQTGAETRLGGARESRHEATRDPGENGTEVWLAADRHQFPVKLLILENDGSKFEQVITKLTIQ